MDYLEMHELYHHGIKGQKWGVRRYQNEDGSLTAAGKTHYSSAKNKETKVSNLSDQELRDRVNRLSTEKKYAELTKDTRKEDAAKASEEAKRIKNESVNSIISNSSRAFNEASRALQSTSKSKVKYTGDYKNLSDKELRDRINRLNMERQYSDLIGDTKRVRTGMEWTRDILATLGSAVTIAGATFGVVESIKRLKSAKSSESK